MKPTSPDPADKPAEPASTTLTPEGVRPATPEEEADDAIGGGILGWVTGIVASPVAAVGTALSIFQHAAFRWVWFGTLLSTMGSWIQNAAKSWVVLDITDSERWLGYDAMATWFPLLLMLPLGGVLADRLDRRKILIAMNVTQGVASVLVGVLLFRGEVQIWHLLTLSAVVGFTQGVLIPAHQSLSPSLVPHDQLRRVVALNAVQFNVCRSIGPAISGWLVTSFGAAWCYFINSFSYLFVVLPLFWIKVPAASHGQKKQSFGETFGESIRYLRSRRDLMIVETVVFWCAFSSAPVMTMVAALTKRVHGGDANDFSHMLSAMGLGALCAAAINAVQAKRFATVGQALPRVLGLGVTLMALGFTTIFPLAVFLMFCAGLMMVGVGNLMQATVISSVPSHLHGRIAGMHVFCFSIGVPLGGLVAGFVSERIGIARVFQAAGVLLCVGVSGLIWIYRHRVIEVDHGTTARA